MTVNHFLFILSLIILNGYHFGMDLPVDTGQEASDSLRILRGPYLQTGTPSEITIRWRTNIPTGSRIVYGTSYEDLNLSAEDRRDTTEHSVKISDLQPDTKYFYGIGNAAEILTPRDSSFYFITYPTSSTDRTIRIWAIGDFGTGDLIPKSVKESYLKFKGDKHTDVWLMLGDIGYTHGTDAQYQKALFDNMFEDALRNTVAWTTFGNHDARSADSQTQTGPYYDIFSLPVNGEAGGVPSGTEAYYAFDYGDIHFISLDTEDTPLDTDGDMINWLKSDLKASNSAWTIVFFHHPPYTKGSHNSDSHWDSGGRMDQVRENILPILDTYGVDLVLSGHSHVYERSYLIANHYGHSKTFRPKNMIVYPAGKRKKYPASYIKSDHGPGAIYVVCGVGGSRPMGGHLGYPAMAYSSDQYRGSMVIEINDNKLYAIFLDTQGKVRDWFRIEKAQKSISEIPNIKVKD